MFDMIITTLHANGYVMNPKVELAFMYYAEYRARDIAKKIQEAKLLSGKGKSKGGKGGVGKKMTEKERAKNVKNAKTTKKPTRTKKTTTTRSRK